MKGFVSHASSVARIKRMTCHIICGAIFFGRTFKKPSSPLPPPSIAERLGVHPNPSPPERLTSLQTLGCLYHSYHYLRNNFCSAAHFLHVPSTPELRLCDADFKFFREELSAFFRGAALAAGLACTPRGVQPVTDGTDTHFAASTCHSHAAAPRPAHTCSVSGVVAMGVSD